MEQSNRRNHSFVIGETYQHHQGPYKVISVSGNQITYAYDDRIQLVGDAEIRWRIHCNIVSKQNSLPWAGGQFWIPEEIVPIFADILRVHGRKHKDFMTHEKLIAAFIDHSESQLILNRPHDARSNRYWVGVMKAHFSKYYFDGRYGLHDCFERELIGGEYAYGVRSVEPGRY